jgi:hypothetical protein
MGATTSTALAQNDDQEVHGIYPAGQYLWTPGQIAANIQAGIVSPTFSPSAERNLAYGCMCLICYHFFPSINEMGCCHHAICTECLACIIPTPPGRRVCPFCRMENFEVRPNVVARELCHYESGEDNAPLIIDESRPDEYNALLLQFPAIDPEAAWEMYQVGIPVEEIAASFGDEET